MGNDTTKPVAEMSDGELLKASCEIVTELVPDGCGASYNRWQPDPARIRALVAAERRDAVERVLNAILPLEKQLAGDKRLATMTPHDAMTLALDFVIVAIRERGGENER